MLLTEYKKPYGETPEVSSTSQRSKSVGLATSIDQRKEQYTTDRDNDVRIPPGSE
jgi:hypothetical protein